MQRLIIDFETFWAQGYTLSKMTTEENIRDPQFEIILVGIKVDDGAPQWFSGTHDEVRQYLGDHGFERSMVIAHNAMFDMAICSWVLGLRPAFICDTLSMARPIHGAVRKLGLAAMSEYYGLGTKGDDTRWAQGLRRRDFSPEQLTEYAGYCATRPDSDVNLTDRLFRKLVPLTARKELALIDETIRMFTQPRLVLDKALLEKHHSSVVANKARLLASVAGTPEDAKKALMSNDKFAELLRAHGVEPPTKISPRTGKEAYAFAKTDQGMTDLLEHEDPEVQALAAARLGVKTTIEETRTARMIGIAERGLFPVALNYCGAVTTARWSGGEKSNPQNWPRGGIIRKAIMAPPGHVVLAGDSSNIELRVNHTLAGQEDAIAAFREKRDLYCEFASTLFGRTITPADKPERFLGKLAHLSLGYGCGPKKFKEICRLNKVDLTEARAKEIVYLWRDVYKAVPRSWAQQDTALKAMSQGDRAEVGAGGIVWTYGDGMRGGVCGFETAAGTRIRYHDLRQEADGQWTYFTNRGRKPLWGGTTDENNCQHLAARIIAEQWLAFRQWATDHPRWPVVLQVHDELVAVGPEDEAEEAKAALLKIMSTPPTWWPDLLVSAEAGYARRYGEAKQ